MSPNKRETGGFSRAFGIVLVITMILGLAALVAYLMSDINQRKYRIIAHQGRQIVPAESILGELVRFAYRLAPKRRQPFADLSSSLGNDLAAFGIDDRTNRPHR